MDRSLTNWRHQLLPLLRTDWMGKKTGGAKDDTTGRTRARAVANDDRVSRQLANARRLAQANLSGCPSVGGNFELVRG